MGIGDAVERGAEAAGFLRRAGVTGLFWGVVILFVAGATMFVVDRVTSAAHADKYATKMDLDAFRKDVTAAQGAYQARVDALAKQVTDNTRDIAVHGEGAKAILRSLEDIKALLRQR